MYWFRVLNKRPEEDYSTTLRATALLHAEEVPFIRSLLYQTSQHLYSRQPVQPVQPVQCRPSPRNILCAGDRKHEGVSACDESMNYVTRQFIPGVPISVEEAMRYWPQGSSSLGSKPDCSYRDVLMRKNVI